MPYLVSTHFNEFLKRISVSEDQAETAETRKNSITDLLASHFEMLDVFPSGSLVRSTAIKGVSDLDVFVVLHYSKHLRGKSPRQVLEMVRDALSDYNARIVKKNGQAVTLYFKSWPNVDIVPAARINETIGALDIPNTNDNDWIRTNPLAHDSVMRGMSSRGRQLVRMIKCWNLAHSEYFRSYHIELVALKVFLIGEPSWEEDDWPWALKQFFEKALEMTGPASQISMEYGVSEWSELRSRLKRGGELASEAWSATYNGDVEKAVERLRVLLGDKFPAYG